MLKKEEHEKAAKMLNFLCFYLKEQEKIDEAQIVASLLYCVAIQSHNGKIQEYNVHKTLSSIWAEVKVNLGMMALLDKKIPEA
jgi:hypothetical protein